MQHSLERAKVCVCVSERERGREGVCVREKEREGGCVCVIEREREGEREREIEGCVCACVWWVEEFVRHRRSLDM